MKNIFFLNTFTHYFFLSPQNSKQLETHAHMGYMQMVDPALLLTICACFTYGTIVVCIVQYIREEIQRRNQERMITTILAPLLQIVSAYTQQILQQHNNCTPNHHIDNIYKDILNSSKTPKKQENDDEDDDDEKEVISAHSCKIVHPKEAKDE
ncbi:MAG: hypothetical protein PHN45_00070 [Methylococcales bacterium]|nr:hypothetical protein [Methylococcales bacterium]